MPSGVYARLSPRLRASAMGSPRSAAARDSQLSGAARRPDCSRTADPLQPVVSVVKTQSVHAGGALTGSVATGAAGNAALVVLVWLSRFLSVVACHGVGPVDKAMTGQGAAGLDVTTESGLNCPGSMVFR